MFGIEGDIQYGVRTKYEWIALQEDCDVSYKNKTLKYRPTFVRIKFDDMEEEIGDWLEKKGKVRHAAARGTLYATRRAGRRAPPPCARQTHHATCRFGMVFLRHAPRRSAMIRPSWTRYVGDTIDAAYTV